MKRPVLSLFLLASAAPAWPAGTAVAPPDKLAACAAIQDSAQRLTCFDQLAQAPPVPAQPAAAATPPPLALTSEDKTSQPARAAVATQSLGEDDLRKKADATAAKEAVHATISRLSTVGTSSYMVYLDNGQVWRHDDSYQGSFLHTGDAVTITRAALGSYRMTRDESKAHNWIRVSRVR
jgi:hypothetical protein